MKDLPLSPGSPSSLYPPENLPYRLKILHQLMLRRFQEIIEPHQVTAFQWGVLSCLWRNDGLASREIGDRLTAVAPTLTEVLDTMERRGLIERRRDEEDRRVWRIWLTADGRALEEKLPPLVQGLHDDIFSVLTEPEVQQLSDLVDRLIHHLTR